MYNQIDSLISSKKSMEKRTDNRWDLIGIAWEMGYLIALPLVGFALGGRFLDSAFDTSPLLLILGIISAIIISTILVVRKTTEVIDRAAHEEGEEDTTSSSRETAASNKEDGASRSNDLQ